MTIDDSVQRATVDQQRAQADAALALLEELRAAAAAGEPRGRARPGRQTPRRPSRAPRTPWPSSSGRIELEPRSVSQDALDTARNAAAVADTNLKVVERQYDAHQGGGLELRRDEPGTPARGAWSRRRRRRRALLAKYTIHAPIDGIVLSIAGGGRQLRLAAGVVRHLHRQDSVRSSSMGAAQDCLRSPRAMSTRSWCTSSPSRRR